MVKGATLAIVLMTKRKLFNVGRNVRIFRTPLTNPIRKLVSPLMVAILPDLLVSDFIDLGGINLVQIPVVRFHIHRLARHDFTSSI